MAVAAPNTDNASSAQPLGIEKADMFSTTVPPTESDVVPVLVNPEGESDLTIGVHNQTIDIPGIRRKITVLGDCNRITIHPDSTHRFIIAGDYNTITVSGNAHVFTVDGDDNTITLSGNGHGFCVRGDDNRISCAGFNHRFTVSGYDNHFTDCEPNGQFIESKDGEGNIFKYRDE